MMMKKKKKWGDNKERNAPPPRHEVQRSHKSWLWTHLSLSFEYYLTCTYPPPPVGFFFFYSFHVFDAQVTAVRRNFFHSVPLPFLFYLSFLKY